ncbi:MAG: diaminopimelate decarboxylase [Proteobacteria bacterium]|nr:diaminopimelate decarboxylase [Pseudomonadota bacterium]MDA1058017.1 diaminopimelate decarboxylase [Pseudomonadota bacterium]
MDHFTYKNGILHAEDVPLPDLAETIGTPFYCYSTATLQRHYRVFAEALTGLDAEIFYAIKANDNLAVIRTLAEAGAGADVVSGGEIRKVRAAGVAPDRIVFSGVGKTREEMAYALDAGILQFNVESEPELDALSDVARARDATVDIAIRINPDVDAGTHHKISTGRKDNKFGIAWPEARAVFAKAAELPGLAVRGVAIHIGSQLTQLAPFEQAFKIAVDAVRQLRSDGHAIDRLDLGGGLGVPYGIADPPSPADYGAMVKRVTAGLGCKLMFEPGRLIVANAGILVTRVIYVKRSAHKVFVITDAAMNDLIRPTLYGAHHAVVPVLQGRAEGTPEPVDIVGPVCESGDILAENREMVVPLADDLLVLRSAGAYAAVMASTYNARPLVPEVMVRGAAHAVVRKRQTYDELLATNALPDWMSP